MSKKSVGTLILIIMFTASIFTITACSKKSPEKKPGGTTNSSNQPPTEVNQVLKDINSIVLSLEKRTAAKKLPAMTGSITHGQDQTSVKTQQGGQDQGQTGPNQQGGKSQGQAGQNQQGGQGQGQTGQNQQDGQSQGQTGQNQQGGKSQGQTSQNQQGGQANQGTAAPQKTQNTANTWQEETTSLKNILRNWNTLEPEAVKAGLSNGARDNFEKSLEDLSKAIGQQNLDAGLMSAISLYRDFGEVAKYLNMPIPPDLFMVKYEAMAALAEAFHNNWKAADSHTSQIDAYWNQFRLKAKDADSKLVDRTEFSLQDIKQAVKSQSLELVALRGEIAINNLKDLEDALSKGSQAQSQGGSQQGQGQQGGSGSNQQGGGS